MDIPLKPEFESMIRERLETGHYKTASSVVEEGLLLLAHQEEQERKLAALKADIQVGLDQLARGEYTVYKSSYDLVKDVEARGLERLSRRKTGSDA